MTEGNKHYKVIFSEKSLDMLKHHILFLARKSSEAAEKVRFDIIEAAKSLEVFPERNSWLLDPLIPKNRYRKMVVDKRYLLIYRVKGETVFIEYVLDCRQDYGWLLI